MRKKELADVLLWINYRIEHPGDEYAMGWVIESIDKYLSLDGSGLSGLTLGEQVPE